jgi:hypothetical protein
MDCGRSSAAGRPRGRRGDRDLPVIRTAVSAVSTSSPIVASLRRNEAAYD